MKMGFGGLGRMGSRMAANCAAAGHDLTVWNRSLKPVTEFLSSNIASSVEKSTDLAHGNQAVITMLANDDAARTVYLGPEGLVAADGASLLVEMGTMSPGIVKQIAEEANQAGKFFVDAPVSGSTQAARDRQLLIMAGCGESSHPELHKVFDAMGRKTIWLGSVGSGAAMKLAINMLIHGLNQTVAEALTLAGRAGIAESDAYDVIENSAAAAPMLAYRRKHYLDELVQDVSFTVDLVAKDLDLALALADELGVTMPQTQTTLDVVEAARRDGFGARDMASIFAYIKGKSQ